MSASSPTPNVERATRLQDTLDMNRKVVQELKEAVENCVKAGECIAKRTVEDAQPSS